MNETTHRVRTGGYWLHLIFSPLAGWYFLRHRCYGRALIQMGLYAGLFWGLCWAILLAGIPFWYMIVAFLVLNGLTGVGLQALSRPKQKAAAGLRFGVFPLLSLLVSAAVLLIGAKGILDIRKVVSTSMQPTIAEGSYILINRYAYRDERPQKDDIVMFTMPDQAEPSGRKAAIKRVAAVGGDTLYWRDDRMFVNDRLYEPSGVRIREHARINQRLEEQLYADYDAENPYTVPENRFFLIGDNYDNSYDSRHFGPVEAEAITGQVVQRIWPPQASYDG